MCDERMGAVLVRVSPCPLLGAVVRSRVLPILSSSVSYIRA